MIEPEKTSAGQHLRLLSDTWRSLARKIDPSRALLSRRTRAIYRLNGIVQSTLYRLQQKSYEESLAQVVPPAPLFVLGFWRSGTTFLHELLCQDMRFGFPSTYACLNPAHFLLSDRFSGGWTRKQYDREVSRPMDQLRYSWSSPQEDEFALLALGAPSAYEALLVPSMMRDAQALLCLSSRSPEVQSRWGAIFDNFLKLLTVQQGKAMVLKSPTHGYRMHALQRKFPAARYVIIERNPYEVFASNMKLWQTLISRYGLERCEREEIEDFVVAAYFLHEKAIAEGIREAAPDLVGRVRYEELEKDPVGEMARLYLTLKLGDFETVRPQLEQYVTKVSGHQRNRFRMSRAQRARIDQTWGCLIAQKGYEWPDSYIDLD